MEAPSSSYIQEEVEIQQKTTEGIGEESKEQNKVIGIPWNYIESNIFRYHDRVNPRIIGGVTEDEIVLDVGCGFKPDIGQCSIGNSIGVDLNFQNGDVMVVHPIMADAQHLPIRMKSIDFVNCQALLEHIPHPTKCMEEISQVMKREGRGFILIPIDSRQTPQTMTRFFKEWPFSIPKTIEVLYKANTLWKLPGMYHIVQINLDDIKRYFKITKVLKKRHEHFWFSMGPFRILRKLGLVKRTAKVGEYAEWYVWIKPTASH
jgi:SAM-dependent methyltransferase